LSKPFYFKTESQSCIGNRFAVYSGLGYQKDVKDVSLDLFGAGKISLNNNDKDFGGFIDAKVSYPYYKGDKITLSARQQERFIFQDGQFKMFSRTFPCNMTYKPNDKTTSVYFNPYATLNNNFQTGSVSTNAGAFLGVEKKITDDFSVYSEIQSHPFNFNNKGYEFNLPDNSQFNIGVKVKF
jgi:hypothetical protein